MADRDKETAAEPITAIELSTENPTILDKVEYHYSSYAQVMVTNMDFRIAFGDRVPPDGKVRPIVGLILPHEHARALLKVLAHNVPKIDEVLEQMRKLEQNSADT